MKMILNGKAVDASDKRTISVYNPATMELIDTVPDASETDVEYALDVAQEGARLWGKTPAQERCEILFQAADYLETFRNELGELLCNELGRPLEACVGEAAGVAQNIRIYSEKMKHTCGEVLPGSESDLVYVKSEPLGVIACIIPFNFPLGLYGFKMAPALAAGNAVIVKPSSDTPLSSIRMTEILIEGGIPQEVLQILTGSGARIGAQLSSSPKLNAISITGSTSAGLDVAKRAAQNMTRYFLELGGNDPLIILDDADLALAIQETIKGRMFNTGQVCCASKRLIVHRSIEQAYTSGLIEALKKLRTGDPHDPGCDFGPLVSEQAAMEVEKQLQHSLSQGAYCAYGGKRYHSTYFQPTVLTHVTPAMDIAIDLEIFGPIFPIIPFDTDEEALAIANQTKFGLSGGVIGQNIKRALHIALQIQSGTCAVNSCGDYRTFFTPFGGHKQSGVGTEGALLTLEEMMQTKVVAIKNFL